MAGSVLEKLAERRVPPPPVKLHEGVHRRLNRALLGMHLVDFVLGAVPYLALCLLRPIGHFVWGTITGRFEDDRGERPREAS